MTKSINGGCGCGAVRYALALDRLPATYACHCLDCQTWSGSAFNQVALLPESTMTVSGPVEICEITGPSGRVSHQRVCRSCHTRLYSTNSARPGLMGLRAGTLDESHALHVVAHIWVKRKQPWITIPDSTPSWPESAPQEQFARVLTFC
jgi:hypothetical protein